MTIIRRGFFDSYDLDEMSVGKNLIEDVCKKCGLYKTCLNPKMQITGGGKRKIYILAESPGETEERENTQLVGRAGQLLRKKLSEKGIDLDEDCWKDNSVRCRTKDEDGKNRKPTKMEIKYCKDNIDKSIKELKPNFIWLFGKSALESFYMNRFSDLEVNNWRNLCIPDRKTGAYILPMYHPSYLLRNENDPVTNAVFERDLDFAIRSLNLKSFEHKNHLEYIYPLKSYNDITDMLEIILKEKPTHFAFDYETTGLKPFNEGHRIIAISGCDNDEYAFSFLYDHDKMSFSYREFETITELWIKILIDPDIIKICHNGKFEDVWSRWIFKIPKVINLNYCTMNSAHIIDSQKRTSLKYQTYINFGIDDYSKSIKKYLETTDDKGFNKIIEAPINELLLYAGIDSLMTKWLFNKQRAFFEKHPKQEEARVFFQKGLDVFADMQITGINTNIKYYAHEFLDLTEKLELKDEQLATFKEVQKFKEVFHKDIDFESTTDLRKLFFTIMNLKSKNKTITGLDATDKNTINEIDHPIAKTILLKRKIKKMRDYVALFYKEINEDERLRPFFNLHVPTTYRSSSDSPNWQNIPVRDEEAKKATRLGIIPSKGNKILDFDYAGIEVRIAACYTKDPTLIAYINDPSTDMHRDTASDLFLLNKKQVSKDIRFYAKNGFVFPEFYGSYYVSTAKTLWNEVPKLKLVDEMPLFLYLKTKGILTYEQFENHVKQVEKDYWIKFKVFKKWQDEAIRNFVQTCSIEMFHGFKVGGYLGKNEIINYRFQGTAFHCLLWSIIEIKKELNKRKLKTKIIGQVHDCCIYDLVPEEQDEIISISKEIATQRLRKEFPWIIVPLELEFSCTGIDQSWYYTKEIKT